LWPFLLLTFAISWGVGGAYLLFPKPLTAAFGPFAYATPAFYLAACAPTLAAVILTLAREGPAGLMRLLRGLTLVTPLPMLALALLVLPLIALALCLAMPSIGPWPVSARQVLAATPLLLFTTAQVISNAGPLGEELGWRGYALPRLLERASPLMAGLILGLIWTAWHVPAFLFSGIVSSSWTNLPWYALGTIGLSLLMTALFIRTRGSVLIAGVIPHFVINGLGATGAWASRPAEALVLLAVGGLFVLLPRQGARERKRSGGDPRSPPLRGPSRTAPL
jgi:membrane protease YdiL (CAAX protease family)